ncbi:pancreatic triacylglycerol lipase-like [Cylas formicarius]|uniref:pancreatic triacylglycerol lipase-like n=1 Tax=Cylas formicarius TaxID=197179 RepID=UPI002958C23B|nr:pancreatic triacylglycerol lipase-like [Cylas formicarius]
MGALSILLYLLATAFGSTIQATKIRDLHAVQPSDITYLFYSRADLVGTRVEFKAARTIESKTHFDANLETFFLVHGWIDFCKIGSLAVKVKEALLNYHDVNVVAVCWEKWSNTEYVTAVNSIGQVGGFIGDFMLDMVSDGKYSLSKITIAGHSLGAHVAGAAGARTNGSLAYIIGLDPAGIGFSKSDPTGRLDSTDAGYVEAIHTNAGLGGITYNVGHSDFWPNGGTVQAGCFLLDAACSHKRAIDLYAESVGKENNFVSTKCDNYDHYINGNCRNESTALMGGFNLETRARGDYYLTTNSHPPYAIHVDGSSKRFRSH